MLKTSRAMSSLNFDAITLCGSLLRRAELNFDGLEQPEYRSPDIFRSAASGRRIWRDGQYWLWFCGASYT